MTNMNSFVADELVNKVQKLHSALELANTIITKLETENKILQNILTKVNKAISDSSRKEINV